MPKRGKGKPSIVVCNHTGWLEIYNLLISPMHPGFTPRKQLSEVPIFGNLLQGLGCLFIERGGSV